MNSILYHTIIYKGETLWYEDDKEEVGNSVIIANEFELIEEQQDIDIQAIEELKPNTVFDTKETIRNHYNKINELVQAVKQLDRKINKE